MKTLYTMLVILFCITACNEESTSNKKGCVFGTYIPTGNESFLHCRTEEEFNDDPTPDANHGGFSNWSDWTNLRWESNCDQCK